jgi:hypothetical protein
MWRGFGRKSTRRNEAVKGRFGTLGNLRGRFGKQEPKQEQPIHGVALWLGIGALALGAAISLLLLLQRRARERGDSTEEASEERDTENEETPG